MVLTSECLGKGWVGWVEGSCLLLSWSSQRVRFTFPCGRVAQTAALKVDVLLCLLSSGETEE